MNSESVHRIADITVFSGMDSLQAVRWLNANNFSTLPEAYSFYLETISSSKSNIFVTDSDEYFFALNETFMSHLKYLHQRDLHVNFDDMTDKEKQMWILTNGGFTDSLYVSQIRLNTETDSILANSVYICYVKILESILNNRDMDYDESVVFTYLNLNKHDIVSYLRFSDFRNINEIVLFEYYVLERLDVFYSQEIIAAWIAKLGQYFKLSTLCYDDSFGRIQQLYFRSNVRASRIA